MHSACVLSFWLVHNNHMLRHPDGQPFTYQELNEFLPAPQGELFGLPGFLPAETVMGLVNLSETIGARKHIYTFPEPLPEDYEIPPS